MSERQRWIDAVVMGLRTLKALIWMILEAFWGGLHQEYDQVINELMAGGFIIIKDGYLRLAPSAYFISNQVLCRFMA